MKTFSAASPLTVRRTWLSASDRSSRRCGFSRTRITCSGWVYAAPRSGRYTRFRLGTKEACAALDADSGRGVAVPCDRRTVAHRAYGEDVQDAVFRAALLQARDRVSDQAEGAWIAVAIAIKITDERRLVSGKAAFAAVRLW